MKNTAFLLLASLILFSCNHTTKEKAIDKLESKTDSIQKEEIKTDSIEKHQTFNDSIDSLDQDLKAFVPKGYSVISIESGNLNLDEYTDAILVLRKSSEASTSNFAENKPDKRPLLILLGQKDGTYKLAYQNNDAVYCIDCGGLFGDPFTGITIKNGYFSIEHGVSGGHHWEHITTFKYNKAKNNWFLYKDHLVNYKLNDGNDKNAEALVVDYEKLKTVKDFGEISFEKFNIYNNK
ncbi:hypothetical protein [Flavobacterium hydatis]|uniref:Lipoprotein n=1 Tax=Flavobacterium hydatis TaxID=991 RepID=A0A086AG46_FLAHY|nr:hypothetical protein [Flavobacterium hydatis]KFF15660.1 hypothetical protein IW20_13390 [Flavobacterium hydatis]OXA86935.1 hypothetical protein B0A62_23020 [Flavobacterium hydatis]